MLRRARAKRVERMNDPVKYHPLGGEREVGLGEREKEYFTYL